MKWYYRIVNGKIGKLSKVEKPDYLVAENSDEMFAIFENCGQADKAGYYGVYKSPVDAVTEALARTSFDKLWLIRAMKSLEVYAPFKALLEADEDLKDEWYATGELNLLDASTTRALGVLQLTPEQLNAIKLKYAEILKG